jgi:hypothetical protein
LEDEFRMDNCPRLFNPWASAWQWRIQVARKTWTWFARGEQFDPIECDAISAGSTAVQTTCFSLVVARPTQGMKFGNFGIAASLIQGRLWPSDEMASSIHRSICSRAD